MLQTRSGKRTAAAALKIAVDLVDEGAITTDEAIMRVDPKQLDALLHPQFDPTLPPPQQGFRLPPAPQPEWYTSLRRM